MGSPHRINRYENMDIEKYLKELVEELENRDYSKDPNHWHLLADIINLLKDASAYKFHDFHKDSADAPKMELHQRLLELDAKMQNGDYDN